MAASNDLISAQLNNGQSGVMPKPNTIVAAATIAPTSLVTFVSGTTNIATITPPADGQHFLILIPTNATPPSLLTTGNILVSTTTLVQNRPILVVYDPNQAKYYPANHAA